MNEIIDRINQHISDSFGVEAEEIQPDDDLRQDLNSSELELVDFISVLELEFHIEVSAEEIRKLVSVSDLYELLLDKLNEVG